MKANEMYFDVEEVVCDNSLLFSMDFLSTIKNIHCIIEHRIPCAHVSRSFLEWQGPSTNTLIYLAHVAKKLQTAANGSLNQHQSQELKKVFSLLLDTIKNPQTIKEYQQASAISYSSTQFVSRQGH